MTSGASAAGDGNSRTLRSGRLLGALALLLPLLVIAALAYGTVPISIADTVASLWSLIPGTDSGSAQNALIINHIRLPRALLAALVGAILASTGAAMQGLFRNPLADPSLIGVTAGASLGASLVIVGLGNLASGYVALSAVSVGAFVGGLITVAIVYRLAQSAAGTSVATMLLAGIAITALAGAISSLLDYFASNEMLRRISLWRMGGLDGAGYAQTTIAAFVGIPLLLALPRYATALNALLLGESEARHLGFDIGRIQWGLIVWAAVGVGASVALAGTIAFVGLVVPHIVRLIIGPDHRTLIPASALAGACLLLGADTVARTVISPAELPVGIITALIGVPFFISLLRQRHQYGM